MISKELLSEVLNLKICIDDTHPYIQSNMLVYDVLNNDEINTNNINIYELAYKCKEWVLKQGYRIIIDCSKDIEVGIRILKNGRDIYSNKNKSEQQIIIKACQWILDNKED